MKLGDFVAETLVEIAAGLRRANAQIAADWEAAGRQGIARQHFMLLPTGKHADDRVVQFDVAVSASREGKVRGTGKAKVLVVDAALEGEGAIAHERASRVRFRVQVEQGIF